MRKIVSAFGLVALLTSCGSETSIGDGPQNGSEGGPCLEDGTCNAGLTCSAGICTQGDTGTGVDSARGDSSPTDSTVAKDSSTIDSTSVGDSTSGDSGSGESGGDTGGGSDTGSVGDTGGLVDSASGVDSGAAVDSTVTTDSATDAGSDAPADTTVATDSSGDTSTGSDADAAAPPYTKTILTATVCESLPDTASVPSLAADNVASALIPLPFAFKFFGAAAAQYSITSNGFLQMWPSGTGTASTSPDNVAIPDVADPNGVVAPFWDDLDTIFSSVRVATFGLSPDRRLVVQWVHWTAKGTTDTRLTFEVKLFETTDVIEFHYCAMGGTDVARATGSSATIGLEAYGGARGIQHSFNTAAAAVTGTALRFTP